MPIPAVQAILACGDELAAALEANDFDRVAALAAERGTLVATLLDGPPLGARTEASDAVAAALATQHRALAGALAAHSAEAAEALGSLAQHRRAQTTYDGGVPVARILGPVHG
ncbi:MAG: hypothetical protein ABJF88_16490 [Rhodothermales bacterium]